MNTISALFGSTILGFFSDEPEPGNGLIYAKHNRLGTDQDLPWSRELQEELEHRFGGKYRNLLPLLWKNDRMGSRYQYETEQFRIAYMDAVSRLVNRDFSRQIGDWCHAHGIEHIGHIIEDDDTHTCTGSGLDHFFRAESGMDMAGIDDIGGQVLPQGEEEPTKGMYGPRNGGFYHYTLGKLGVSSAALDPEKQGRCLCGIFGNYGGKTGVSYMKYLADHFLVRGVNYFVPHAFSPKPYPDRDCPPHFYAGGNNPQYRHIGDLFRYMNRVSTLTSGGEIVLQAAILYNAEADWVGECESLDRVARILYDHQLDYTFLPLDRADLAGNFQAVLIPPAHYWPESVLDLPNGIFVDALQENLRGRTARVVPKDRLVDCLNSLGLSNAVLTPASPWIHCLHYRKDCDLYLFVNEGARTYHGSAELPLPGPCYLYHAWENRLEPAEAASCGEHTRPKFTLKPRKSLIVLFDEPDSFPEWVPAPSAAPHELKFFLRSRCRAIDYPVFGREVPVSLPDCLSKTAPAFSGYVRYRTTFTWSGVPCTLVITGPAKGVEVFVNGKSAGRQIVPAYRFDLSSWTRKGKNELWIVTASTLERENAGALSRRSRMKPAGLTGRVLLYQAQPGWKTPS